VLLGPFKKLGCRPLIQSENSLLLVDPYKNLLHAYRILFEQVGLPVETAANMEEARVRLSEKGYALVLSELFFPDIDVLSFWKDIKSRHPETYLILMTDSPVDEEGYERIFEAGADDLIVKPFPPERLLVHIRRGLRRALIMEQEKLARFNLVDPISQEIEQIILNHDYFKRSFRQEIKRARRYQDPVSLLLVKTGAPETKEHEKGSFLVELAKLLRKSTREEDIIGRENGGFGILLYKTGRQGSTVLKERLNHLIQYHSTLQVDSFQPFLKETRLESFTYPDETSIPEPFYNILQEITLEFPRH
jgi:two-component system cell cycle response regulator